MGVCCEGSNQSTSLQDLSVRESATGDRIENWELANLPFSLCSFFTFEYLIGLAHIDSGEQGYVTVEALGKHFTTNAWAKLRNKQSSLCQMLLKHMGHQD